jgi:hypothetical protein
MQFDRPLLKVIGNEKGQGSGRWQMLCTGLEPWLFSVRKCNLSSTIIFSIPLVTAKKGNYFVDRKRRRMFGVFPLFEIPFVLSEYKE